MVMLHGHHVPVRPLFNSGCLGQFWKAEVGKFSRAPKDLMQVKYEMLRRVQVDQATVSQASQEAGLSRPAFYQAQAGLQSSGLVGLIPQKPGPRGAHKLTVPVLAFLRQKRAAQPELTFSQLAQEAGREFGIQIHPRTIERVLSQRQKKR
jgi:transposase